MLKSCIYAQIWLNQFTQLNWINDYSSIQFEILTFRYLKHINNLLVTDQYFIDYKPKNFLQSSPHLKGNEEAIIIRQVENEILNKIKELSKQNKIYIVSGGLFNELSTIFNENGFLYRSDQLQWNALFNLDYQCLIQVRKIFNQYAIKTEGVEIERKESSISLKLKNSDEYIQQFIQDLVENVQIIVERYPTFQLIVGSNSIEVSPKNLNKGMILDIIQKENLQRGKLDFVLIIARGIQNEDIFSHLKLLLKVEKCQSIFSIQGLVPSYANYYLNNQQELIQLLKTL